MLHFGAVNYRATVWVNDVEVARHEGGHSPFTAEVTAAARTGENVLVVRAEDPLSDKAIPRGKQYWTETPEGIFYTATTGIWQSVWLEPLPARHVTRLSLVPDLRGGAVDFEVDPGTDLVVTLDGEVVGRSSGEAQGRIRLERAEPWHPDSPRLYGVEARDGRFWLNGQPFIQRLVLDQGYFPGGLLTSATDEDLRRDIDLAKAMGFNGARKHQKAEDPRWLYWADVLGFLVWSEMPSFHEHSQAAEHRLAAEWANVVQRDRGHPCIVTWVPSNESFGLGEIDAGVRSNFLVRLYQQTRAMDATRPIVSNDGWEHSLTDLCTAHDYSPPE